MTLASAVNDLSISIGADIKSLRNTKAPISLYAKATSDLLITTSTMVNVPGMSLVLEPFSAYDIDLRLMYTAQVASAAALKIGFANFATTANIQADYRVATTNLAGTAPWRTGYLYGNTSLVSGASNAQFADIKLHALLVGRVVTGADSITLITQVGLSAASTTNTISISATDIHISGKKVSGP